MCKVEVRQNNSAEVTRCVVIQPDFTWNAYVHGKELSHSACPAIESITEKLDPDSLQQLVAALDECKVCCGNYEQPFVSLLERRNGSIRRNDGTVTAYLDKSLPVVAGIHSDACNSATVRSTHCEIVASTSSKCSSCAHYRNNLRAMISSTSRVSSPKKKKRLDTGSHTNYRYLHTSELKERLHNSRSENKTLSRKIEQLKRKIQKMTQSVGVTLDDRLNSDMHTIVSQHSDKITHPPDSFAQIFWEQQKESMLKHPKQMRWHPMMIKWCIHLKMLSSSCYNSFRSSGQISTLRNLLLYILT